MYGVVVCPRCKRAKGVDMKQKTTACPCGFEIRVSPTRVRARAETARELAPLVGRVNAELSGGSREVQRLLAPRARRRPRDVHAWIVAAVPRSGDRATRIRAAAAALTDELELFTEEDWSAVLQGLGIGDAPSALEQLVRMNVVYKPKEGFYRTVDLSP